MQYKSETTIPTDCHNYYNGGEIGVTKRRLARALKDDLSQRSRIFVALIERSIKELQQEGETMESDDKFYAIKMLENERKIYESHIIRLNLPLYYGN